MVITAGVLGYGGGVWSTDECRVGVRGRAEGRRREVKECEVELRDIRTGSMSVEKTSKHSASS